MEGKLVDLVIAHLAESDKLDAGSTKRIQGSIDYIRETVDGLGFCLSEKGDLLSQWRGYAADATGVAIGFSKDYLQRLKKKSFNETQSGFNIEKIKYNQQAHDALVEPTYRKVKELIASGAFRTPAFRGLLSQKTDEEIEQENELIRSANSQAYVTILSLFSKLFLLKSLAFKEEHEWRLVSYLGKGIDDSCSYRSVNDQVVPYRAYELLEMERSPIAEVILGPKHQTPVKVVQDFLKQNGFGDVKVIKSAATYR
jgi:hypothetical protein